MPNWDPKRWIRLKDGSYRRRQITRNHMPTFMLPAVPIYTNMTRGRLMAECERRGLKTYGSKATLIARLEKNDGLS